MGAMPILFVFREDNCSCYGKEEWHMILFAIMLVTFVILAFISISLLSVGGAAFIVIFGDIIVCMAIMFWLAKILFKKKKK